MTCLRWSRQLPQPPAEAAGRDGRSSSVLTFADPIGRALRTGAAREAVVCGEDRLSFTDLAARLHRLGGALHALGLTHRDRVAILSANCHRYLETYLAVPAAGLVLVPLNTRHAEPELRYALADSGAR